MIITREWLLAHGADPNCDDLARFTREWPDGVEVTHTNLNDSCCEGLRARDQRGGIVAGAQVGTRTGAADIFDQQAGRHLQVSLLLGAQFADHQAEAIGLLFWRFDPAALAAAGRLLFDHLADRHGDVARRALAPDLNRRAGSRLGRGDQARQVGGCVDRLAIEPENDIARFQPGLVRRPTLFDGIDDGTHRLAQAQ